MLLNEEKKFIDWLRKAIKLDKILKGKELAAKTGIDASTISRYLSGDRKCPDIQTRFKICEALGVDYADVVGLEEFSKEYQERMAKQEDDYYKKHPQKLEELKHEWQHDAPPDLDIDILAEKVADKLKAKCSDGDIINKKIEKHQKLVGGFEHQEIAIEINQALLELEKIQGKDGLLEIKGVKRHMLREAEKKKGAFGQIANGTEGS